MWIDSHCHITADRFDEDRQAALDRAFEGGIETLISIGSGYGIRGNADAIRLAESDPRIFAAVGVHPHEAAELDDAGRAAVRQWRGHCAPLRAINHLRCGSSQSAAVPRPAILALP